MPLPSFIFNAEKETPETLARRRALAEAMLNRGQTGVASNVGEGLAQLGQALGGRIRLGSVNRAETANKSRALGALGPLLGMTPQTPAGSTTTAQNSASGPSMGMSFNGPPTDLASGITETANALNIDPVDLATAISYETAGTFNPTKVGPRTKWGQHRGLIQWGEPQAREYGVDWNNPVGSQLGANGAIANYLRKTGVKPGMGMMDIYSAINAGRVGRYGASDAAAGGAPGTVADKVRLQMAGHRAKAQKLLGLSGSAGSDMLGGSAGADTLSGREDMQDVPPGFILQSTVENGQFVQKVIPDPRKMAGVQPGLSAPSIGGPRPQPGLSSPPVPQSQAPSQAVPAAPPQVQPAVGPAPQAPQMAPQAPLNAYQRMMATSLGKEAGGLQAPPNRAQMAAVMGNAGSMQSPFAQVKQISQPIENVAYSNPPTQSADIRQISGRYPAEPMQSGGNRLAVLQGVITSPSFAWLEPAQQQFVMDEYKREQAAANPDPMAKVQLETAQVNLDKLKNPKPEQPRTTTIDGVLLVEQPDKSWKPAYTAPPDPKSALDLEKLRLEVERLKNPKKDYLKSGETFLDPETLKPVYTPPEKPNEPKIVPKGSSVLNPDGTWSAPPSVGGGATRDVDEEMKVLKQFEASPGVKRLREIQPILKSMEGAIVDNTGANDLDFIYGIAKVLDPESVVREGEMATVQKSNSIPEQLRGVMLKALFGEGSLTPEVRKQLFSLALRRGDALLSQAQSEYDYSSNYAKGLGMDPGTILRPLDKLPKWAADQNINVPAQDSTRNPDPFLQDAPPQAPDWQIEAIIKSGRAKTREEAIRLLDEDTAKGGWTVLPNGVRVREKVQ